MRIEVKVISKSSRNFVKEENGRLKVYVTAPRDKNKANKAVIEELAAYFNIKKNRICIIQGERSSVKVVGIES
jgi:uncharacterized protein YggU (UPF0235/DUF167 family)